MRVDALKGHLDALLLAVFESGPHHGYGIIQALRQRSDGRFDLPSGTVYPALHRLERAGLITSRWSTVDGRRRRTYALSTAGHRALDVERMQWREFSQTVSAVLG